MRDNRIKIGNGAIVIALMFLTIGCWNEYAWYQVLAPYCTVISFVALGIAMLCYVDWKNIAKDRQLWLVVAGCLITLVNIIVVHSGIGAFFTVADLLMVLYLVDKIKMSKKLLIALSIYIGFYFYYWTVDVKGYFKGYNTNYGGLVLITGLVFALTMFVYLLDYATAKNNKVMKIIAILLLIASIAIGYNIIAWYRSRCALLGYLVIVLFILLPKRMWANKAVYSLTTAAMTIGAILISIAYVILGKLKDYLTIRIFYKDIISGREEIWSELWGAFLQKPVTGIGSSYQLQVDFMNGIFEVHNGLLDILIVHGSIVFAIVIVLLVRKLMPLREKILGSNVVKTATGGIMAVLATSFLENFFIVPPFLLTFLFLFVIAHNCE